MPLPTAETIAQRLQKVREQITLTCQRAGRPAADADLIEIVAVTKTYPAETVRAILSAGLTNIGENKVQEAESKREEASGGTWRLIGHLQSNKARRAAALFDAVDSVDSIPLARALEAHASDLGRRLTVLLQVNTSGEASKSGIAPDDRLTQLAEAVNELPSLQLEGLMTIAPFYKDAEKTRPAFARLRECRDRLATQLGLELPLLSMGMTHDFTAAVAEGATMLRLGTALVGPRLKLSERLPRAEFE